MDKEDRLALLDTSLERAAEQLGDITPDVMARFYARFPRARERFETLYLGEREKLEGEMVEQTLYCLMEWYADRGEVEIILYSTIPHHVGYLKIEPRFFSGLIDAVCETIVSTIPVQATDELETWNDLQQTMRSMVSASVG